MDFVSLCTTSLKRSASSGCSILFIVSCDVLGAAFAITSNVPADKKTFGVTSARRLENMSNEWYSRPVLFVSDIDRSVDFYVKQFGFTENWLRAELEGRGVDV